MRHNHPLQWADREGERGVALILAVFFTLVVVGITVTGSLILKSHQAQTRTSFISHGQAVQFSKSGLIEALGWVRKQTAQPVLAIEPQLDMGATPPIIDTIDPAVGIAREFQITNSIWGRYEVWKRWDADPDSTRLAWRQQFQCMDISEQRGDLSPGSVWRIRSLGYVFRRVDPNVAFNVAPNQVLGQELTEVEARRLALQPPGQAAICVRGNGQIQTKGRVVGGSVAVGIYHYNAGTITVSGAGASCTGTIGISPTATYEDSFESVFGVSQEELTAMADFVVSLPADFPSPVAQDAVVLSNIGMTFTAAQPLSGTGVVAIIGNTTISPGSYSAFSGLLYVQGNLTIREPCEIQGAVVVTGTITVLGGSDFATVSYDDAILEHLRQEVGTYRLSSAMSRPLVKDQ